MSPGPTNSILCRFSSPANGIRVSCRAVFASEIGHNLKQSTREWNKEKPINFHCLTSAGFRAAFALSTPNEMRKTEAFRLHGKLNNPNWCSRCLESPLQNLRFVFSALWSPTRWMMKQSHEPQPQCQFRRLYLHSPAELNEQITHTRSNHLFEQYFASIGKLFTAFSNRHKTASGKFVRILFADWRPLPFCIFFFFTFRLCSEANYCLFALCWNET